MKIAKQKTKLFLEVFFKNFTVAEFLKYILEYILGYFLNIKKNLDYISEYLLKFFIVFEKLIFEKLMDPNRAIDIPKS